jgi:hypothetical protein
MITALAVIMSGNAMWSDTLAPLLFPGDHVDHGRRVHLLRLPVGHDLPVDEARRMTIFLRIGSA